MTTVQEAGSRGGKSAWRKSRSRMLEIAQAGANATKAKAAKKRKAELVKARISVDVSMAEIAEGIK